MEAGKVAGICRYNNSTIVATPSPPRGQSLGVIVIGFLLLLSVCCSKKTKKRLVLAPLLYSSINVGTFPRFNSFTRILFCLFFSVPLAHSWTVRINSQNTLRLFRNFSPSFSVPPLHRFMSLLHF